MKINFEKKYVHCFWDDELAGKKCFVANDILTLKRIVEKNETTQYPYCGFDFANVKNSGDIGSPFKTDNLYTFAYYDPNYEVKLAWCEGKDIQFTNNLTCNMNDLNCEWTDLSYDSAIDFYSIEWDTHLWRIKPTEEYVPFETIDELIKAWEEKCPSCKDRLEGTEPLIWIKPKIGNIKYLIDCFNRDSNSVAIYRQSINLQTLFDKWLFADVTVCGKRKD